MANIYILKDTMNTIYKDDVERVREKGSKRVRERGKATNLWIDDKNMYTIESIH